MALKPNSSLWQHFNNLIDQGMAECKLCKQRLRNNRSYNLKQHLKRVHNEKNELWNYFDNYIVDGVAVCKMCKHRLKNRACNLRLHMRRTHDIEVKPPKYNASEPCSPPQPYDEERIQAVLKVAKRKMDGDLLQFNDNKSKKQCIFIKMDKYILIRSVLGFVVEDRMTLHAVCSKHMQKILQPICSAISEGHGTDFKLDEAEIERLLNLVANYMRNEFSNELHWRLLSLKIDTDINAPPNTFCLSAVFINEGQVQTRVLGIIELKDGSQLTEAHIKEVLHKFNIDSNQIISAYWDNTKGNYLKPVSNSEYLKEIENFEKYPDMQLGDIKIERYIGSVVQQCVLDVLKNPTIFKTFLECRNLVKFVSDETSGYHKQFEKNGLTIPQLDSPWKWGSTYTMMKHLLEARFVLENVKCEQPDCPEDQFCLNSDIWSYIYAFCRSMNIMHKSILKFYNEELHFGDFYAQWLKCRLLTEKLLSAEGETNSHFSLILTELAICIKRRSQELLTQDRSVACLYLDPRFQRTLNLPQKSKALEYLKKLWSRSKLYNFEIVGNDSESVEDISTTEMIDDDEDVFLNEFLSQDVQVKDTKTADVYRKIEGLKLSFHLVDTNILLFWKGKKSSEPEMHALSTICFAIPATQNYCKQIYGHFYKLEDNSNLSAFTKENLLNIRLNADHLTAAVRHLEQMKDNNSNASVSSETESEDVVTMDEDNDSIAASTFIAHSTGEILASKMAKVDPISTAKLDTDFSTSKENYSRE